ncbi:MAG TPA: 2,3-diphosphoglycerate-dependent phosphoglycerate mutase [Caulobacteraceae bacterium]|nr:2,3-diphosphoglycerate-dependent phosphoglycerate mutase [Caulobacteraceae bacterium]
MPELVLLRHGQSQWNLENRFTGWVDVDLSDNGVAEAERAGALIAGHGLSFDIGFTSVLKRAIRTSDIALARADQLWIPVEKSWRLNERHYGGLTGLDKAETARRHGEAQVRLWRRSFDTAPPPLPADNPWRFDRDRRYAGMTPPASESLKDTLTRVTPYWDGTIVPRLREGLTPLVSAHGNSLRAIMKLLFAISDGDIVSLEMPTGNPLLIELDRELRPTRAAYLDSARAEPLPAAPA